MRKIKITQKQYDLIHESEVKGGVNRVNRTFAHTFSGADIENLKEKIEFSIKDPLPGVPHSKMTNKDTKLEEGTLNEDIFSPEVHEAIKHALETIWKAGGFIFDSKSQKGLDDIFVKNGLNWGDITQYLGMTGIIGSVGAGMIKIKNLFKRKKNDDEQKAKDLGKLATILEKKPNAPWSDIKGETTLQKKEKMQQGMEWKDEWDAKPKSFKQNSAFSKSSPQIEIPKEEKPQKTEEPKLTRLKVLSTSPDGLAILQGSDGNGYVFGYDIKNDKTPEQIEMDVNSNLDGLEKGEGVKGFDTTEATTSNNRLIKIDDELKRHLVQLYSINKKFLDPITGNRKFVRSLDNMEEMTSEGSSGAFTGAMNAKPIKKDIYSPVTQINDIINDEEELYGDFLMKEMSAGGVTGTVGSSATGEYVQPAIWAKDKANWAASKKTQYPNGEMVEFDPCTKLNNNKKAQNGGCSQGAVDNVVKTHRTKDSVISKNIYETISKKTGRSIEDVKKIIEENISKKKLLIEDDQKSNDDLNDFHKNLIQKVKSNIEQSRKYDIGFNEDELKNLIKKNVLTPFVLATLKLKYGIDLKDFYVSKTSSSTQYHRITEYNVSDKPIKPSKGNVNLEISIEIPKDDEIVDEYTYMQVYFYLKNNGRYKGISELVNVKLTPDVESTQYKIQDLLHKMGNLIITKLK